MKSTTTQSGFSALEITLGVVVLLVLGGSVYNTISRHQAHSQAKPSPSAVAKSPTDSWITYAPAGEGYSVKLPTQPTTEVQDTTFGTVKAQLKVATSNADSDPTYYAASAAVNLSEAKLNDPVVQAQQRKTIASNIGKQLPGSSLLGETTTTFQGYAATDFFYGSNDGQEAHVRVIMTPTHIYDLFTLSEGAPTPYHEYFDSMVIDKAIN